MKQKKQFKELSEEELEKVTGGFELTGGVSCKITRSTSCGEGYYYDGRLCCPKCNTNWTHERELCAIKGLYYSIDECHCV